jgi:hypothetical protein
MTTPVCGPSRSQILHNDLRRIAYDLWKDGREEDALVLCDAANSVWDDAIHIASPQDPTVTLCGNVDRNMVALEDRPDGWAGCWSCLTIADRLAVPA